MNPFVETKSLIREFLSRFKTIFCRFREVELPSASMNQRRIFQINLTILFLLINGSLSLGFHSHRKDMRFEHISIEQGLSQSTVSCIIQDKKGFMWFGTEDGLNMYDGYIFTVYKKDPKDPTSLSDSYIISLYEDRSGALWVGTEGGGLNRFDREKEKFTSYKHNPENPASISHNYVTTICEDQSGVLWVGTREGLNRFDKKTAKFTRYKNDPENPNSLSHNYVNHIFKDEYGMLWIGTEKGLNKLDPEKKKFTHYFHDPNNAHSLTRDLVRVIYEDKRSTLWVGTDGGLNKLDRETGQFTNYVHNPDIPSSLSNNFIRTIYEDRSGCILVGTYGGGINMFDRQKGEFIHLEYEPGNPNSLANNYVNFIYEDRTGILWIGTFGGGISQHDPEKAKFIHYKHDPKTQDSISTNIVFSIYEDRAGYLWIGTYGGGISKFDRKKGKFTHYKHDPDNPNSLCNNNVRTIHEDSTGLLWIGTYDGLDKFDPETERFIHYRHDPDNPHSLSHDYVRKIYEDKSGTLWMGTFGGLNKFDREKERFTHYKHNPDDPHSLSNDRAVSIFEDAQEVLWVGTGGGLNRFDREKERFIRYNHDPTNPESLSNDRILSIYEDREGSLWLGTYGGGLNKFNRQKENFTCYREKEGLPNEVVYGILEDNEGHLWMSTNRGLSKFDPRTETFENYDSSDGLQSNEFNSGAYHKSKSGEMFFGGINGFNAFYPDKIKDNPHIPPVVITDFQIFNESISIGKDQRSILDKSITETEAIELSYKDRVFSFEFAALGYSAPDENEYAYMLEGFDSGWNYVGNRHFATYTNLAPGDYMFRAKASNNDGVWNEEGTSLRITINPPFWQTWWFRLAVAMSILFLFFLIYQIRTKSIRERARHLEERVQERTAELKASLKEKEVLLKEIHHRVKNNMQIISSLLNLQSRSIKDEKSLAIFKKGQDRIRSMSLIHEKLYRSKDLAKIDFARYIQDLSGHLLQSYRADSNAVRVNTDVEDVFLDINTAIPCGLIVNELISNALKHAFPETKDSPESSNSKNELSISLHTEENGRLVLTVRDNGSGMPEDFDVRNTDSLGLRLVFDLVEQLEGSIDLQRSPGTTYRITFSAQK